MKGMSSLTYYCFSCYGRNDRPDGPCAHCGEPIEAPPGTSYFELLLWALRHSVPDVAMQAAATLGARREERARESLRQLALTSTDPILAAQALQSLIDICGTEELRPLLEQLAVEGAAPSRRVATAALERSP
jgi:HEAT repeat protein